MNAAVSLANVSVTLGGTVEALKDVTADLPAGQTVGVIGPSGAGKTTLIKSIVGRQRVTSGQINVLGLVAGSPKLRSQLSYMTQELSVYPDLTVYENLRYFAVMFGIARRDLKVVLTDVLTTVELTNKVASLVKDLSGGQKQRVSLAIALIGKPKLMVLDEPTVGLDPVLRDRLWKLFARLADQGTTLVISSHSMDEAARCQDLLLIRDGQLIAHSSPTELLKSTATKSIEDAFLKLVGGAE